MGNKCQFQALEDGGGGSRDVAFRKVWGGVVLVLEGFV